MDYTTLIAAKSVSGSLANWVNNGAIPASEIVVDAESWIYERLRTWEMLATLTTLTFTIGQNTVALPDGFIAPRAFWITGADKQPLVMKTPDTLIEKTAFDSTGAIMTEKPQFYYWDGSNFVFNTLADDDYATWLVYFKRPAALSASNTTNFVTSKFSRMFRLALRGIAFEWLKDMSNAEAALALAADHIERINMESGMAMANLSAPVLTR